MAWSQSFLPQLDKKTRILILGSMPSVTSLQKQAYYAHPRNLFWPFMQEIFSVNVDLPYDSRIRKLNAAGIGLWDVYQQCYRPGSLDAAIAKDTVKMNDFAGLLADFPNIGVIATNGQAAFKAFQKHVASAAVMSDMLDGIKLIGLPSTSPANASMSYEIKLSHWQVLTSVQG